MYIVKVEPLITITYKLHSGVNYKYKQVLTKPSLQLPSKDALVPAW